MVNQQKRGQAHRLSAARKQKPVPKRTSFAWIWLLCGMLIGVLGLFFAYQKLYKWPSIQSLLPTKAKRNMHTAALQPKKVQPLSMEGHDPVKNAPKEKIAPATRKHFEFYQLLPGMEVPISNSAENSNSVDHAGRSLPIIELTKKGNTPLSEKPALTAAERPVIKQPLKFSRPKLPPVLRKLAAAQYLLQVGAFKSANTANALKGRLAAQGFTPRVYKVEAEDGIWFRVTLGPYPSEAMALKQKSRLERQKVHAVLILQRQ